MTILAITAACGSTFGDDEGGRLGVRCGVEISAGTRADQPVPLLPISSEPKRRASVSRSRQTRVAPGAPNRPSAGPRRAPQRARSCRASKLRPPYLRGAGARVVPALSLPPDRDCDPYYPECVHRVSFQAAVYTWMSLCTK